jgi:hypothetical protein
MPAHEFLAAFLGNSRVDRVLARGDLSSAKITLALHLLVGLISSLAIAQIAPLAELSLSSHSASSHRPTVRR